MYVLKKKFINLKRNKNKIIFNNFLKKNKIKKTSILNSKIYFYNMKNFYDTTFELFKKNIFCWAGKKLS